MFYVPMAQQLQLGQGLLIIEASRTQSDTPHSVGRLWTSNKNDADQTTQQAQETDEHVPAELESAIPTSERP